MEGARGDDCSGSSGVSCTCSEIFRSCVLDTGMSRRPSYSPSVPPLERQDVVSEIVSILRRAVGQKRCRVYLFGSRATGHASAGSDFDIAISSEEEIDTELSIARELLESSNIPYKVDLINLRMAPERLVESIRTEGVLLWTN